MAFAFNRCIKEADDALHQDQSPECSFFMPFHRSCRETQGGAANHMKTMFFLVLAGGLGALSRYAISSWIHGQTGGGFPWGTMAVNVTGCLLFGLLWSLAEERYLLPKTLSFIVLTGFVGSFTTFSTMTFETLNLIRTSSWLAALLYLGLGQVLGIIAAVAGIEMAKTI